MVLNDLIFFFPIYYSGKKLKKNSKEKKRYTHVKNGNIKSPNFTTSFVDIICLNNMGQRLAEKLIIMAIHSANTKSKNR